MADAAGFPAVRGENSGLNSNFDGSGFVAAAEREISMFSVYEVDSRSVRRKVYSAGDSAVAEHVALDGERMRRMLNLIGEVEGQRVLELGANPYILTLALARAGAQVEVGGHPHQAAVPPEQVVFEQPSGQRELSIRLSRFNVEADAFPYESGSFDVLIAGELIEHLAFTPDRFLMECNRVLRAGGRMLLTTPNAVSLSRALMFARGRNPDWPFSSQGIYARHNRLYTAAELADLFRGNHFGFVDVHGLNLPHPRVWYRHGPLGSIKWRALGSVYHTIKSFDGLSARLADALIVAAVKESGPVLYRPPWLFGGSDTVPMVGVSENPVLSD